MSQPDAARAKAKFFGTKFEFCRGSANTMSTRRAPKKVKKPTPTSVFDVIVTFREREQLFLDPFVVPKGIPEPGFVQAVFAKLDDDELDELVKISVCMHFTPAEVLEAWIPPRQGKFYFNPETNDDEDTIRWASQKNSELVRRQKL